MSREHIVAAVAALAVAIAAAGAGTPDARAAEGWRWPLAGEVITPYRNGGDPYASGQHRGIDVAAAAGTPVVAATAGAVRFAGRAGSSGVTVSLRTSDGRFDTSYLHLSSVVVRAGDRVRRGARIGAVGTSGRRSVARPHLHFGVREAGTRHAYHDPLRFLPPPPRPVEGTPRVAPVPIRAPVRVRLAPAPRGAPARAPVRVPAGRRVRLPRPGRVPRPSPPAPAPAPQGVPVAAPARPHAAARRPVRPPAVGPRPAPAARPQPSAERSRRGAAPAAEGGFDPGWALACAGLVLAAACLGDRRAGGPGRRRAAGAAATLSRLRALPGRR